MSVTPVNLQVSIATLVQDTQDLRIIKYLDVSPTALLIYDYLLTLGREKTYVWKPQWSLGKVLFLLNRYSTFVDTIPFLIFRFTQGIDPRTCQSLYRFQSWLYFFGLTVSEVILIFRTSALWSHNRWINGTLITALIIIAILSGIVVSRFLNSLIFSRPIYIKETGCIIQGGDPILFLSFLCLTLFECVIVILTVIKVLRSFRGTKSTLTTTIYRDGLFFFAYLCILSIANVVMLATGKGSMATLLTSLYRMMHSILSSRILLNLREAAHRDKAVSRSRVNSTTLLQEDGETEAFDTLRDIVPSGISWELYEIQSRGLESRLPG